MAIEQRGGNGGPRGAGGDAAVGGAAFQAADGTGVGIILRDKADRALHTQDMTLNVGPQHPATHGCCGCW